MWYAHAPGWGRAQSPRTRSSFAIERKLYFRLIPSETSEITLSTPSLFHTYFQGSFYYTSQFIKRCERPQLSKHFSFSTVDSLSPSSIDFTFRLDNTYRQLTLHLDSTTNHLPSIDFNLDSTTNHLPSIDFTFRLDNESSITFRLDNESPTVN